MPKIMFTDSEREALGIKTDNYVVKTIAKKADGTPIKGGGIMQSGYMSALVIGEKHGAVLRIGFRAKSAQAPVSASDRELG